MRPLIVLFLLCSVINLHAQKVAVPANFSMKDEVLTAAMPQLSNAVIQSYKDEHNQTYWDNLVRLYLVAQRYRESVASLDSLMEFLKNDTWEGSAATGIQFRAFALVSQSLPVAARDFATLFTDTLTALYDRLPGKTRPSVERFFSVDTSSLRVNFEKQVARLYGKDSISVEQAISLLRSYNSHNVMRKVSHLGKAVLLAEDIKKYTIMDSLLIPGADGSELSAVIFRRKDMEPQPVVMMYNIYAGTHDRGIAKTAAERGYVGVVVNTRGKYLSPQDIAPFEHDAADAYAVIDWLSKQPWCNGKIGMYGGSYLGFSQWSAVKKLHPALKTIVPQVAVGPGVDYPMHNGIFMPYMLRWIHFVANNKLIDGSEFGDAAKWDSLFVKLYRSGKSFRSLDTLDGRPNAIYQRWLDHPAQDHFWQNMVPYQKDFASINIPVLTTTGYFDDDQRGAFYYFREHNRWNKKAEHYMLIGPYDHSGAQSAASAEVMGYKIDSIANININETVWEWFDHYLKGGAFPTRLKDRVNYQVMGANEWRSGSSLQTLHSSSLTLYLSNVYTKDGFKLDVQPSQQASYLVQEIDYLDRAVLPQTRKPVVDTTLFVGDALKFISEPLKEDVVMTGSLEGELRIMINKKDVDLSFELYALQPDGKYFQLSNTLQRASFIKDPAKRTLLRPGIEETIPVYNSFFTSKKILKGSRLILIAGMNKSPYWQVNYGTGKEVSLETMEDGKVPLQIKWSNKSYIKIPLSKL
jgi:uncharacterized protein